MLGFSLVSLTLVDFFSCTSDIYHYSALISFSCIIHFNIYLSVATLTDNIAFFKNRSDSKDVSKLFHWLIWIKVCWILQVEILKSTADATFCYLCQKLFCTDTREIVSNEIKDLEIWCLFTYDFCQHFNFSFNDLSSVIILEPRRIVAEI